MTSTIVTDNKSERPTPEQQLQFKRRVAESAYYGCARLFRVDSDMFNPEELQLLGGLVNAVAKEHTEYGRYGANLDPWSRFNFYFDYYWPSDIVPRRGSFKVTQETTWWDLVKYVARVESQSTGACRFRGVLTPSQGQKIIFSNEFPEIFFDDTSKRTMIRYWRDLDAIVEGRPAITTTIGRYLRRHFPDMSEGTLQEKIAELDDSPLELQLTSCPDKIEEIYTGGPSSCMAHKASEYQSSEHPVRVYGNSPNLSLAWIERNDKIVARCLVLNDKSGYARIYGDTNRMIIALQNAGWNMDNDSVEGGLIQKIECENNGCYILPYLDDTCAKLVTVDGRGYFKLIQDGSGHYDYYGDQTTGLCEEVERNHCEYLEEHTADDVSEVIVGWGARYGRRTQMWSERAIAGHATYSALYGAHVSDDVAVTTGDGEVYCQEDPAFQENYAMCCLSDEYWPVDDMVTYGDPDNGEYCHPPSVRSYKGHAVCALSGAVVDDDDIVTCQSKEVSKYYAEAEGLDIDSDEADDLNQQEAA